MPKLVMPGDDKPKAPPKEPSSLEEFRTAWARMVLNNRLLEAKASEIVALVESTPDIYPDPTGDPDFVAKFRALEYEMVGMIHQGQRHVWATTALAARLGMADRAVVESKVGPLFDTKTGALGKVWRENWLCGRQLSRASTYRRLLGKP